jgi:hypothetical protein
MKYIIDPGNNGELVERVLRKRVLPRNLSRVLPRNLSRVLPRNLSRKDSRNKLWESDINYKNYPKSIKRWKIFEKLFESRAIKNEWNFIWKLKNITLINGVRTPLYEIPQSSGTKGSKSSGTKGSKSSGTKGSKIQIVNHFPNSKIITDKDELGKLNYKNPKSYIPKSFIFKDFRIENFDVSSNSTFFGDTSVVTDSDNFLILKPSNLQSGKGIRVFSSTENKSAIVDEIVEHIKKVSEEHPSIESWVFQEYIPNPFLYKGRKFDIRVHFLMTDEYDIYICNFGFVRVNSVPYTQEFTGDWNIDKFVHITNHAIQKQHPNFGKNVKDFGEKNVLKLDDLAMYIDSLYTDKSEDSKNLKSAYSKIFNDWKTIIRDLAMTAKNDIGPKKGSENSRRYFELFGMDILLDENLKSWVLEVNQNPGLDQEISWTGPILEQMIDEVFQLTVDKFIGLDKVQYGQNLKLWEKI